MRVNPNYLKVLGEGYTVKFFFQSVSWNTVSGAFHEPWNTFMKYFYFSISNIIVNVSHQYKDCVYREKISSDSENLIALILINNIFCSKQKQKSQKDQSVSEWNHTWKTGATKKHMLAYFQNFGWMTNSSIIFEWVLHLTIDHTMIFMYWLLFTCYITYTYNSTVSMDYFGASTYTNFYNSLLSTFFILQITSSLLRN